MKQEQTTMNQYVPPAMTVVELKTEQGFAASGTQALGLDNTSLVLSESDDNVEDRLDAGGFGTGMDVDLNSW